MEKSLQELEGEFSTEAQAKSLLKDAQGYMKVIEGHLQTPSRFDVPLLHNIANISFEKLLVALLAYYGIEALNHTPMALFIEASKTDTGLTESMRQTAKYLQRHESICSLDGTGYSVPTEDELHVIIIGLIEIRAFVEGRLAEL